MNKVLDSMNAHYNGKLREAEASMGQMFIAFRQANDAGVDPAVIKQAQDLHSVAHTNWEWWTDYQYGKQRLREIDRRIRFLNKRIEASEVIDIDKRPPTDQIFFGATIVYANEQGDESKIRIVGIDEADASVGDVSWISPIARVFLKHFEGDTVLLPAPKGVKKLEILEVTYVNDPPGKPHII